MTTTSMKRYTSLKSNLFSPHSSNIVSQNLVYMQMSHHYRRLLNAKSNVDSSQPRSFRTHERQRRSRRMLHVDTSRSSFADDPSPSEMALVDRMVYDDKHGPDLIYRDHLAGTRNHYHPRPSAAPRHDCTEARVVVERPKQNQTCRQSSTQRTANKPPPCDLIDRHCDIFESADPYKPRILKSTAQSRVRDLKVYHPPRRKLKLHKAADWDIQTEVQQQCEEERVTEADEWLQSQTLQTDVEQPKPLCAQCQCEITHEQPSSKVSIGSRDSAYNGGVSSGGESRGPTPEQINLANMSANIASSVSRCEESPDSQLSTVQCVKMYDRTVPSVPSHLSKRDHVDWFPSSTSRSESMQSTTDRDRPKDRPSPCLSSRRCVKKRNKTSSTDLRVADADDSVARDDVRYAAFSERITTDILCREVLSNKGINKLFQRHIEENMELLDMTLMQKEIDMLRVRLDIEGNDDSNMNLPLNSKHDLYPSCPAPCTTQYFNLSMRNQLVQTVDSSQTLEILDLADNENELKLLTYDYETPSPKTIVKEGVDTVSTEVQTEPDSEVFIEDSSSDTNTDTSSLRVDIRQILDQILTDNISSIPNLIAEPVVNRENSVALDDVLSETESDHSHQSDAITDAEVDEFKRSLTEDKLFGSSWTSDSSISCSKKKSEPDSSPANSTYKLDNPTTPPLKDATKEDPSITNSKSDIQTRCCFIKKRKKTKDDHKPNKTDKKLTKDNSPYLENELRRNNDKRLMMDIFQDGKTSTTSTTITKHDSKTDKHVSDEELSWAEMDSKSSHLPPVSSTSLSSKSSLGATIPAEAPRVRRLSDPSTRKRSTYLEASSSSSSNNSSLAVKNFRELVRKSNEANQKLPGNSETI